jgi:hypothetical protein
MDKAKRLIQTGNVTLLRNGYNTIVANVIGDHGQYQSEISRDDPQSRAITQWTCECPWDQFAFQRTRQWKKYEARPCAHVLAAFWKSQSAPLDEDVNPGFGIGQMPTAPPGSPSPFGMMPGMGQGMEGPAPPAPPENMTMPIQPQQQGPLMPSQMPPYMQPPAENPAIPPYPYDQARGRSQ